MPTAEPPPAQTSTVRVWDFPIRLFHWLLVGLLAFSWWSGEQHEMEWHRFSGYAILALLIFRIYWGFFGGRTARFAQFLRGPRATVQYARSLIQGPYTSAPGHNPIGGWSVMLMLSTLIAMVVAGLFSVDVDGLESGPLADYVSFDAGRVASGIHEIIFKMVLTVTAIHVLAIAFYYMRLRHNLIAPMIHGRRRIGQYERGDDVSFRLWKAALGILIAAACTYAIAQGLRF